MTLDIKLPSQDGMLRQYRLTGTPLIPRAPRAPFNRIAYSAAHVAADPLRAGELSEAGAIDWQRTIEYRRYLLGQGLGIAEAMDTAQRGMGLGWGARARTDRAQHRRNPRHSGRLDRIGLRHRPPSRERGQLVR